jgi:hypothetical protein
MFLELKKEDERIRNQELFLMSDLLTNHLEKKRSQEQQPPQ